jgi:hypothetical protein
MIQRNSTTYPELALFTPRRVLNDLNGFLKFRFNGLSRFFIPDNKASGRTVSSLFNSNSPRLTVA